MSNRSFLKMFRQPRRTSTTSIQDGIGADGLALLLLLTVLWLAAPTRGAIPEWLRAAAQAPLPKYPDDTDAVLLRSEQITTVNNAGEVKTLYRRACKILRPQGRDRGIIAVYFDNETRLTSLKGWSIPADGKEYDVGEKDAIETSAFTESLYGDMRHKVLKIPAAEPGNIIGYEYEQRERPSILQDTWQFQDDIPVLHARLELHLPTGWEYQMVWINHVGQKPEQVGNNQWAWELQDIPAVEEEPGMPAWRALAGRLGVSYFPPGATPNPGSHRSWRDVGLWYARLAANRRQPTAEIKQKVMELCAGAPTTLEKITAVASFVQRDIRYVAIEIGIGGFQPHAAQDIFSNRYGDCKDKATLLSTMLAELGLKSYYVLINDRRGVIAAEFPSPLGFNHVILAIQLPNALPQQMPLWATANHPQLGRLLFFDPTDTLVPLGDLPETLQQNRGLLVTDSGGELVELPLLPPNANRLLRTAKLTLTPDGTLSGEVTEIRWGAPATEVRARLLKEPESNRQKSLENFLGEFLGGAILQSYGVDNLEQSDKPLAVQYHFQAANYAKAAGDLLLVRPRVVGQKQEVFLEQDNKKKRKAAVEFPAATSQSDVVEILLPSGYKLDELPPPTKLDTGTVGYESRSEVAGNVLRYIRTYQIRSVLVPLEHVEELRDFYRRIAADERSSAVLKRNAQ